MTKSKKSGIMIVHGQGEMFVLNAKDKKKFLNAYGFNTPNSGRELEEYDVYELNYGENFEIKNAELRGSKYKI